MEKICNNVITSKGLIVRPSLVSPPTGPPTSRTPSPPSQPWGNPCGYVRGLPRAYASVSLHRVKPFEQPNRLELGEAASQTLDARVRVKGQKG
jgi:hypothetical protein